MTRRSARRLFMVGLLVVVLALSWSAYDWFWPHHGGPLASPGEISTSPMVSAPVSPGQADTFGFSVGTNDTNSAITIDSIEPVSLVSAAIAGIKVYELNIGDAGIGTARGYPPPGIPLIDPKGATIPPHTHTLWMVIGGKLAGGATCGAIRGIRIRYHVGHTPYVAVEPWTLELRLENQPGSSPPVTCSESL